VLPCYAHLNTHHLYLFLTFIKKKYTRHKTGSPSVRVHKKKSCGYESATSGLHTTVLHRPSYEIEYDPRQKTMSVLFPPMLVNVKHRMSKQMLPSDANYDKWKYSVHYNHGYTFYMQHFVCLFLRWRLDCRLSRPVLSNVFDTVGHLVNFPPAGGPQSRGPWWARGARAYKGVWGRSLQTPL